jgi:hypothetical protein
MTQEPASAPDGPAPPGNSPRSDGSPDVPPPPIRPAAHPPVHPASGYPAPANAWPPSGYHQPQGAPSGPAAPGHPPGAYVAGGHPDNPAPGYPAQGYPPPGYPGQGYPGQGYPGPGYGGGYQPTTPGQIPVPRLPGINRLQPVGGTPFAYAYVRVPPVTSGLAIGSLIAGIASIAVALGMVCLGLSGASDGWGALVAGAFAILSILLAAAAIAFGRSATRMIRRAAGATSGSGMANAGMTCGWVGAGLSVIGFFGALAATLAG